MGAGLRDQFISLWTIRRRAACWLGGRGRPTTSRSAFGHPGSTRIGFLADVEPGVPGGEARRVVHRCARGIADAGGALEGAVAAASWGPSGVLAFIGNPRAGRGRRRPTCSSPRATTSVSSARTLTCGSCARATAT